LGVVAKLSGRGKAWEKLTASLEIDSSDFRIATGWNPPVDNHIGVIEMAQCFLSKTKSLH